MLFGGAILRNGIVGLFVLSIFVQLFGFKQVERIAIVRGGGRGGTGLKEDVDGGLEIGLEDEDANVVGGDGTGAETLHAKVVDETRLRRTSIELWMEERNSIGVAVEVVGGRTLRSVMVNSLPLS